MDHKIKLYCIPFAGGSAMAYCKWKKNLDDRIKVCPVELTGRGRRMNSPLYGNFHEAVNDIYNMIHNDLDAKPYAIFGHSMGSLLAFELYHKIMESNHTSAKHLFFSGRVPPNAKRCEDNTHSLPEQKFIQEVFKLGGMSEEFIHNRALLNVFLPIIRSDYKLVETYHYKERQIKIDCKMSVLTGKQDQLTNRANITEWRMQAAHECNFYEFEGGHFFIDSCQEDVTDIINKTLLESI